MATQELRAMKHAKTHLARLRARGLALATSGMIELPEAEDELASVEKAAADYAARELDRHLDADAVERARIIEARAYERGLERVRREETQLASGQSAEDYARAFAPGEVARIKAEFAASGDPRKQAIAAKLAGAPVRPPVQTTTTDEEG